MRGVPTKTINYATENLKERAKELTDGQGVDVVYDCVGGDYAEQALRAIGWEGRFSRRRFHRRYPVDPSESDVAEELSGGRCVSNGAMTARDPELSAAVTNELIELTSSGELAPHVSGRYSLENAGVAMRAMMDRRAAGKLVIVP